jgi:peptidoglycan/LPS O-acetylase OafA/YrhL
MRPGQERIFGLDVIRTTAVLLIVFHHTFNFTHVPGWLRFFGPLGSLGAEALLVLSGYLIGHGLLKKSKEGRFSKSGHLTQFYFKRWMRTLPPYYFYLLVMAALFPPFLQQLWIHKAYFIFLQNFAWKMPSSFYAQTWTLAVLEFFYLLFPLVLLLASKIVRNYLACFLVPIALFLAVPLLVRVMHTQIESPEGFEELFRKCVIFRLDTPIAGVVLAMIEIELPWVWMWLLRHCWMGLIALGASTTYYLAKFPLLFSSHWFQVFFYPMVAVSIALMFPLLCSWKMGRSPFHRMVCAISQISYSIYVSHYFALSIGLALLIMAGVSRDHWVTAYLLFAICAGVIADLSYRLTEAPFIRLRESKLPNPSYFLATYRSTRQRVRSWFPSGRVQAAPPKPAELTNK